MTDTTDDLKIKIYIASAMCIISLVIGLLIYFEDCSKSEWVLECTMLQNAGSIVILGSAGVSGVISIAHIVMYRTQLEKEKYV